MKTASVVRVVGDSVRESSTRAARDFARAVRSRLEAEVSRHGEDVTRTAGYRRLEQSITPDALRATWPNADVDAALDK